MNTKARALLIVVLFLLPALVYLWVSLLFHQEQKSEEAEVVEETVTLPEEQVVTQPEATTTTTAQQEYELIISGTLVGFDDGKEQLEGSFKYALINDGTEILRVDLRNLIGYEVTALEEKLGVSVGESVTVFGYMESGVFVPTRIQ